MPTSRPDIHMHVQLIIGHDLSGSGSSVVTFTRNLFIVLLGTRVAGGHGEVK